MTHTQAIAFVLVSILLATELTCGGCYLLRRWTLAVATFTGAVYLGCAYGITLILRAIGDPMNPRTEKVYVITLVLLASLAGLALGPCMRFALRRKEKNGA